LNTLAPTSKPASADDVEFVVRELGAGRTADEVCRMLCEQRGYTWPDAQRLAREVAAGSRTRIARRQAPFLIFLGLATLAGGLLLIGFAALRYYYPPQFIFSVPRYQARIIASLAGGILLTLGSIVGLAQVLRSMK
jgi:hypothetical protein